MKKSLLVVALLMVLAIPAVADQGRRLGPLHSQVKGVVRIPVAAQNGMPVVDVYFGNKGPYRFTLDTSVKCSLIVDKALAKELALPHRGAEKILNPATRTMSPYEIVGVDRVSLGQAQFTDVYATVDDIRGPFQADGIVGFGLFAQVLAALDLGNGELRISRGALPKDGPAVQSLKLLDGVPSLVVNAAGQHLFASVNTEVPMALTVPKDMTDSLPITGEWLKGDLQLGAVTLADARVAAVDAFPLPNIGNEFLSKALVTFDTAHGRVAVEPTVRQ